MCHSTVRCYCAARRLRLWDEEHTTRERALAQHLERLPHVEVLAHTPVKERHCAYEACLLARVETRATAQQQSGKEYRHAQCEENEEED